jgi:hypothetical protein
MTVISITNAWLYTMGIKMWRIIALRVCPVATRKLLKATPYSELCSGLDDEILVEAA